MIPARLLNATVEILAETATRDAMGAPVMALAVIATMPGRADQKSVQDSGTEYVKTATRYKVFINGGWDVDARNWVRVTIRGASWLGQVGTVAQAGLMGHHTEIDAYSQFNPPPIVGANP